MYLLKKSNSLSDIRIEGGYELKVSNNRRMIILQGSTITEEEQELKGGRSPRTK